MSDRDRILYSIKIFFKQTYDEIEEECQSGDYKLILDQILQTNITNLWKTVTRVSNEILPGKEFKPSCNKQQSLTCP